MRLKKSHKVLCIAFVLFTIAGLVLEFLSHHASIPSFSVENFQKAIFHSIEKSDDLVTQIANDDNLSDETLLDNCFQLKQEIAFLFIRTMNCYFGTTTRVINEEAIHKDGQWHFVHLPNAYGIYKWYNRTDQ